MNKELFSRIMSDFIMSKAEYESYESINSSKDLIIDGLIDSFMILEIVGYIGSQIEIKRDLTDLSVNNIRSIDEMYNFFVKNV